MRAALRVAQDRRMQGQRMRGGCGADVGDSSGPGTRGAYAGHGPAEAHERESERESERERERDCALQLSPPCAATIPAAVCASSSTALGLLSRL